MTKIVSQQLLLRQSIPTVVGCIEYSEFCKQLGRYDQIIETTDLDKPFIIEYLTRKEEEAKKNATKSGTAFRGFTYKQKVKIQIQAITAFRCAIARALTGLGCRKFHVRLADSDLLKWFTKIDKVSHVKVPSKSKLDRDEKYFSDELINEAVTKILDTATGKIKSQKIELEKPLNIEDIYMDSTCIKTNIHYSVDWTLFRDAIRTLMKATYLIRAKGLKHRMDDPKTFMKKINRLSIQMSSTRRKKTAKRERKRIVRLMKKLLKKTEGHAFRHRNLLENHWKKAGFGPGETKQILKRIDNILKEIERIIFQAHERIIGERQITSDKKLISLYEKETQIIVRGKLGAEVEFGNTLLLSEQQDGLIVDWELFKDQAPSDSKILKPSLERTRKNLKRRKVKSVTGDRGFWSPDVFTFLKEEKIKNYVCPRSVPEMQKRLKNPGFREHQERRGQTEGRIGIFKNCFLGRPLRSKGFANRKVRVGLCVLTHNLWILARIINKSVEEKEKQKAA